MPREKYIPRDNQWISFEDFDADLLAQSIYDDVGAVFVIRWDGEMPIVDFDDLPPGVTENEVKQAIRDNHPHRK